MNATANDFPSPNQLCFTRFEFADAFRVSVRTVDRMIAAGEIQPRLEIERRANPADRIPDPAEFGGAEIEDGHAMLRLGRQAGARDMQHG